MFFHEPGKQTHHWQSGRPGRPNPPRNRLLHLGEHSQLARSALLTTGAISPDARWCVVFGASGASVINDLTTSRAMPGNLEIKGLRGAVFSPDGKLLAGASDRGFTRIWDAASLQETATLRGSQGAMSSVAFSPDSQRLATGCGGRTALSLWDVESLEELLTLEGQGSMFNATAFSPDGAVLGSMNAPGGSRTSILHLWRAPSWAEIEAAEKGAGK